MHNMEPICFAISLPSIYYALNLNTHALVKILDPSNLISNVRSLNFVKDKSRHFDSKYLLFLALLRFANVHLYVQFYSTIRSMEVNNIFLISA